MVVRNRPHRYGHSRTVWDHTVLSATTEEVTFPPLTQPIKANLLTQILSQLVKNVGDIRDQKFVLPEKVAKIYQNRIRPATP